MLKKNIVILPVNQPMFTKMSKEEVKTLDSVAVSYTDLTDVGVHAYLSSHTWELLACTITDDCPLAELSMLVKYCQKIKLTNKLTKSISGLMQFLCAIQPKKTGQYRLLEMSKKSLLPALEEVCYE